MGYFGSRLRQSFGLFFLLSAFLSAFSFVVGEEGIRVVQQVSFSPGIECLGAPSFSADGSSAIGIAKNSTRHLLYVYRKGRLRFIHLPRDVTYVDPPVLFSDGSLAVGRAIRKDRGILYEYRDKSIRFIEFPEDTSNTHVAPLSFDGSTVRGVAKKRTERFSTLIMKGNCNFWTYPST